MNKTISTLLLIIVALLLVIFWPFSDDNEIIVPPTPTATSTATTTAVANKNITVKGNKDIIKLDTPTAGYIIDSPVTIKGQARGNWYFEGNFPVELVDANGKRITMVGVQTSAENWMTTEYVPFQKTFEFPTSPTRTGTLILHKDNPSDIRANDDSLRIPIVFAKYGTTQAVKVYFSKSPIGEDCSVVNAVTRNISNTQSIGKVALEELLKGPTTNETAAGYQSSLNPGTKLNSLTIVNGVAKADFNSQLDFEVGGSCRVTAIRSQITETLKQFPTVTEVIISKNGRSQDILQP